MFIRLKSYHFSTWSVACGLLLAMALGGFSLSLAQDFASATDSGPPPLAAAEAPQGELKTLREGSRMVDQAGVFRTSGDRAVFETIDGKQRLTALENLNLERIMRMVNESTSQLVWTVDGVVTEYHGGNFLLINHAVRRISPAPVGETPSLTTTLDEGL